MVEVLAGLLGTIVVGLIGWTASSLLETNRTLAVHAEKHSRHDARLEKLEGKVC